MAGKKEITNGGLYEAINSSRLELKGDIGELRRQLSRLEIKYQDMKIDMLRQNDARKEAQAVLSTKFLVVGAIGIAAFNALLYGFFTRVLAK